MKHLVVGAIVAFIVTLVASRRTSPAIAALIGVTLTCTAELVLEIVEWRFMYRHARSVGAYFDTIADLGMSLAGALVGAAVGLAIILLKRRRDLIGHPRSVND